ncbi:uncharacterized protein LOC121401588 isoform X6 [Xenopus laevis]|uniref:Uncharacterized protein LOC121401588 isoform X6 n=1 Tax=Xenopus laevis TaxID=8355 RepID=A0A8J1MNF0_XENLA|nr:uncharacterized protein LOC121401588 isoform X6 [Xenopus laevis]
MFFPRPPMPPTMPPTSPPRPPMYYTPPAIRHQPPPKGWGGAKMGIVNRAPQLPSGPGLRGRSSTNDPCSLQGGRASEEELPGEEDWGREAAPNPEEEGHRGSEHGHARGAEHFQAPATRGGGSFRFRGNNRPVFEHRNPQRGWGHRGCQQWNGNGSNAMWEGMVVILSMEVMTIIMSFFLHLGNGITRGYLDGQWDRSFHIGMVIGCRVSSLETGRKRRAGCSGGKKEHKDKRRRLAHQQGGKKKPIQQIQGCRKSRKRIQAHRDQSWQPLQRRHLWVDGG